MLKVQKEIVSRNRLQSFHQAKAKIFTQFYHKRKTLGKQSIANKVSILEKIVLNTSFIDVLFIHRRTCSVIKS